MTARKSRKIMNKKNKVELKATKKEVKGIIRTLNFGIKREAKKGNNTYEFKVRTNNVGAYLEAVKYLKSKGFRVWNIENCYTVAW